MSMAMCLQGMATNGGSNGAFGNMNLSASATYGGGTASGGITMSGGTTMSGGSSPSGTQAGAGFNLGAATDQLAQTGLSAISKTVPVWTSSLFGQQSQNQLAAPTYSGLGTQPGLTSGAGPVLPGPQPAGGVPAPSGLSTTTLLLIGAAIIAAVFIFVE
jgi:hypothetical protein